MKALRIGCFAMGLISIARTVYIYSSAPSAMQQQQQQPQATAIVFTLFISIASTVICVLLARKLNRSAAGWGIFGFFLSYISCFILPFLKERDPNAKSASWWNTAGNSGNSGGSNYGGTSYYGEKTCSRCGRVVSSSSRAGQSCPHCGAYWSTETEKRKY
jgi:uncharacterized membrane protein YgcG